MICRDCETAETDPLHPLYNVLPCCCARQLMNMPERFRRQAAKSMKSSVSTEFWHDMRDRLEVLIEREAMGK